VDFLSLTAQKVPTVAEGAGDWEGGRAAGGGTGEQADIERATAQMERAQLVATMPHGSYSLGETAAKQKMLRLVCDKCGRRGQYRIDRLLEQYGPDVAMPDLRHELAQCPHRQDMSNPCQVDYVD
jgi:hypothetical protein